MKDFFLYQICICYFVIYSVPFSQVDTNKISIQNNSISSEFMTDVQNGFDNEINFLKRPLHFDSNDLLLSGSILGATSLVFLLDKPIYNSVNSAHSKTQDDIVIIGHYYGNGLIPLGLSAVLYTSGLLFRENELKNTGKTLAEALIASGITVTVVKVVFGRSRPYHSDKVMDFNFFEIENKYNSFFSGHAIIAFTTSAVLSSKINNIYATIGLYGLASLTAYQRIYSNSHWTSDTLLGAITGILIGNYFANLDSNESKNSSSLNINILPIYTKNLSGISFFMQF